MIFLVAIKIFHVSLFFETLGFRDYRDIRYREDFGEKLQKQR